MAAHRTSAWRSDYEVSVDDRPFATFARSAWRGGGAIEADGRHYDLRSNGWLTDYTLADEGGTVLASAHRVGRKDWTVDADGVTYRFRRASVWRMDQELHQQGMPVGSIRSTSIWRGDAVADLPGMPPLAALFALTVVLSTWEVAASAG